MMGECARYAFRDEWRVAASPPAVRDVLVDLERYPEWWRQVVAVASLGPDDAWVRCRSVLPYTLDLRLTAVSRDLPSVEVAIAGDLDGFARWTITPEAGPGAHARSRMLFEQDVSVRGPLAAVSRVMRPLLSWNHARMMAGGRAGLAARLREGRREG